MSDQRPRVPPTRANAIQWARSAIEREPVFLDTETCGKDPREQVCDIGIVLIDGTVLLNQLVKPADPIPSEASAIHGITNEMVADAPSWPEVQDRVGGILDGRLTVIYNAQYDTAVLRNEGTRIGAQIEIHFNCAMLAYSDFDGTLGKFGTPKWWRLEDACRRFGIEPGVHRALADAEATRQLVLAMAAAEISCRSCGCTDSDCSQCVEAQGHPCHWVELDLCSRCAATATVVETPVQVADRLWQQAFGRPPR